MVFYARHNKKGLFCRTSSVPENIQHWDDEVVVADTDRITYSHPVYLRHEKRFYVFWRGSRWKPAFATSVDGRVWSRERILIQGKGKEAQSVRPYLKVYSKGDSVIHFTFTDGHPRNEPTNSVYYLAYRDGAFFKADGTRVARLENLPIDHRQADSVYAPRDGSGRSWVWDIAEDQMGRPVIAYTRMPTETEHLYHYVRWNKGWDDLRVCGAGRWFPETPKGKVESEPHYSGGLALNHRNPLELYLSRQINGQFELERWVRTEEEDGWTILPLTQSSDALNVRPVVARGAPVGKTAVLWMRGKYEHYTRYQTQIRLGVLRKL